MPFHVFQPLDLNDSVTDPFNPFSLLNDKWGALTTMADGRVNIMTISWGGVGVLWGKNVATIYIRKSRFTHDLLESGSNFSVTFFDDPKYKNTLKYLGAASGRNEDKVAASKLHINVSHEIPFIDEGSLVLVCRTLARVPMNIADLPKEIQETYYKDGDAHDIYFGEILEMMAK